MSLNDGDHIEKDYFQKMKRREKLTAASVSQSFELSAIQIKKGKENNFRQFFLLPSGEKKIAATCEEYGAMS